jgi:MoaA/NifB/PqqE/SkfB family radical SAM enzyme
MPVISTTQIMYTCRDIRQVHLEVTTWCNASCPQCSRNMSGGAVNPNLPLNHLSLEDCKKIFTVSFLKQLHHIFLCGNYGDAIMAPATLDILEYFRSSYPDILLSMHTNGSGRNAEWWRRLARSGTICKFAIDGLEDTNSLYRKGTSWHKIMAGVEAFIGAGGIAHWEFIVFKHNQHQVGQAKDLSKKLGFKRFNVKKTDRFYKPGIPLQQLKREIKADSVQEGYSIEPPDDPAYIHNIYLQSAKEIKTEDDFNKYLEVVPITCQAVTAGQVYVSAQGLAFPCCYLSNIYKEKNIFPVDQVLELIGQLAGGKDALNVKVNNIEDVIAGDFFTRLVPETWDKPTFSEGKLYTCARTCGDHNFCVATSKSG